MTCSSKKLWYMFRVSIETLMDEIKPVNNVEKELESSDESIRKAYFIILGLAKVWTKARTKLLLNSVLLHMCKDLGWDQDGKYRTGRHRQTRVKMPKNFILTAFVGDLRLLRSWCKEQNQHFLQRLACHRLKNFDWIIKVTKRASIWGKKKILLMGVIEN